MSERAPRPRSTPAMNPERGAPGGRGYVPQKPQVICTDCGATVTLSGTAGGVLRRHIDPAVPPTRPRPQRICLGSRTDHYIPKENP